MFMCIGLNPSTADEVANDPTVERVQRRAQATGFGGIYMANLFAWRSTDPKPLRTLADPIGPDNDAAILAMAQAAGLVLCAWGNHGLLHGRGLQVAAMLRDAGIPLHALKITSSQRGSPCL